MVKVTSPSGSRVIFSSLSPTSTTSLSDLLTKKGANSKDFKVDSRAVLELMKDEGVDIRRVCLLDPRAEKEIAPEDGEEFDWFLFGGILGDDPPRDRTGELRRLGFPTRHLGPIQMTTDTALNVTKICVQDKIRLSDIPFVDTPNIKFDEVESVDMPFRYVTDSKGEPILPDGMRQLLQDDMNKSFDEVDDDEE
ncbi:hypothetical protein P7C70_g3934, partial [Phenoliferia sp. Uapishka_3]